MSQLRGSETELAFLTHARHGALPSERRGTLLDHQLTTSPLVTFSALEQHATAFPSRALLGTTSSSGERIYLNTNAPSSGVICGVQGAGKSHTVSCILESALIPDERIGQLPKPLAALVCHFNEEGAGGPCEAAYLSQPSGDHALAGNVLPKVTVLCSPSNITRRRRDYAALPNVEVHPLYLAEQDLTASRMLAIMGCDNLESMPLYLHSALMIIRSMGSDSFSYTEFRRRIRQEDLNPAQRMMINLRLDLLDAYLRPESTELKSYFGAGQMVLVDLTDPFLDGITAAILFDIALGSFMQWETDTGKLFVLDEAHKVLTSNDAARLTRSIAGIIRQQRHLATRVVIATQEPTVIPRTVLDLASFVMCHRFSSPAWCKHLAGHVSAGSDKWLEDVMMLETGEALVFSAASLVGRQGAEGGTKLLGQEYLRVRVRPRLTSDGGTSVMAIQTPTQHASVSGPLTPKDSPSQSPDTSAFGRLAPDSSLPAHSRSIAHAAPRPAIFDTTSLLTLAARLAHPPELGLPSSLVPEFSYSPSRPSSPLSPPASEYSTPILQHATLPPFVDVSMSASELGDSSAEVASESHLGMPLTDSPSATPNPLVSDAKPAIPTPTEPVAPAPELTTSPSLTTSPRFDTSDAVADEQEVQVVSQAAFSDDAEHVTPDLAADRTPPTLLLEVERKESEPEDEEKGLVFEEEGSISEEKGPVLEEESVPQAEVGVVSEEKGELCVSDEPEATVDQAPATPIELEHTVMPLVEAPAPAIESVPSSEVAISPASSPATGPARALSAPPLLPITPAAPSVPAEPAPTPTTRSSSVSQPLTPSPRFSALIDFLRKQQTRGIHQVFWTAIGQHVKTRLSESGSQLPVQSFLREAAKEGLVVVTGRGATGAVSLLPITSAPTVSSPANLPAPLASVPVSTADLTLTPTPAAAFTPTIGLTSMPTPSSHSRSSTLPEASPLSASPALPAPRTASSVSAPQTPSSRFDTLPSVPNEQPAQDVHPATWSPDIEDLTPRMAADGTPRAFLVEADKRRDSEDEDSTSEEDEEEESASEEESEESADEDSEEADSDEEETLSIDSDHEDGMDRAIDHARSGLASTDHSVPPTPVDGSTADFVHASTSATGLLHAPLVPPPAPVPPTISASTSTPAPMPASSKSPVPAATRIPVPSASTTPSTSQSRTPSSRFNALLAFLRQEQARGNRLVTWNTVGANVSVRPGANGVQLKVKSFLKEAEKEGLVLLSGEGVTGSVSLTPVTSPAPAPTTSLHPAPPYVPLRFRVLDKYLQEQLRAGVSRVFLAPLGPHVQQRLSSTGTTMTLKAFVEDAQQAGFVTCGGSGNDMWVSLRGATPIATPAASRVPLRSISSPAARPASIAGVPQRFRLLVTALQARRQKGQESVPWTTLAGGLQTLRRSSDSKSWVADHMNDAVKAGVIETGGTKGNEWAKLVATGPMAFV